MHLNVVDKLLHYQGHCPLVISQTRNFHSELSGGKLWIKLYKDTNIIYSNKHIDMLCIYMQTHALSSEDQHF